MILCAVVSIVCVFLVPVRLMNGLLMITPVIRKVQQFVRFAALTQSLVRVRVILSPKTFCVG